MSATRAAPRLRAAAPALARRRFCAALAGCTYRIGERDLLHPKRLPEMSESVTRRNVTVRAADGTALRGWFLSPGARRALLWFYGNARPRSKPRPALPARRAARRRPFWPSTYRATAGATGRRASRGSRRTPRCSSTPWPGLADPGTRFLIAGRSLGTVFALQAALERPAAGLVLFAPPDDDPRGPRRLGAQRALVRAPLPAPAPDETVRACGRSRRGDRRLATPLLVVHGTETGPSPSPREADVRARRSRVKRLCDVQGAGHNNIDLLRARPPSVSVGSRTRSPALSRDAPVLQPSRGIAAESRCARTRGRGRGVAAEPGGIRGRHLPQRAPG